MPATLRTNAVTSSRWQRQLAQSCRPMSDTNSRRLQEIKREGLVKSFVIRDWNDTMLV
jgi:hypothetical protein